jgi:hypothetical protein
VPGQFGHVGRYLVHARGDRVRPGELLVGPVDRFLGLPDEQVRAIPVLGNHAGDSGHQARELYQHDDARAGQHGEEHGGYQRCQLTGVHSP